MTDPTLPSDPVFIDVAVAAGSEQYPISIVVMEDTPARIIASNATVKTEPECKMERSTSPLAPYMQIQPRRIRCKECHKYTAETEEKMLRHVRKVHRGENPFQCYMCDYSTYNKCLFEEHVRIHQGIKPFKCSHCPYASASKKNAKKHELIHRPDNPHKCQHCGFIARHLRSLKCHINTEHRQKSIKLSTCQHCKRKVEDLEAHVRNRIKCQMCDLIFCSQNLIRKHMISDHSEKSRLTRADFVCAICEWASNIRPKILLHLIHHPNQTVNEKVVDVQILKDCGIVGKGW